VCVLRPAKDECVLVGFFILKHKRHKRFIFETQKAQKFTKEFSQKFLFETQKEQKLTKGFHKSFFI